MSKVSNELSDARLSSFLFEAFILTTLILRWDLQEFAYLPTAGSERVHSNIVHYKDQVLATGGCEKLDNCYNTVEAFDWATETWVEKSAIPLPGEDPS